MTFIDLISLFYKNLMFIWYRIKSFQIYSTGDKDDRDEDGVKRKKKKKRDRDGTTGSGGNKSAGGDSKSGKGDENDGGDGSAIDGDNAIEEELHMMDEITSAEKIIHCQIGLMEINRRLCAVIGQPC